MVPLPSCRSHSRDSTLAPPPTPPQLLSRPEGSLFPVCFLVLALGKDRKGPALGGSSGRGGLQVGGAGKRTKQCCYPDSSSSAAQSCENGRNSGLGRGQYKKKSFILKITELMP